MFCKQARHLIFKTGDPVSKIPHKPLFDVSNFMVQCMMGHLYKPVG